jgi:H+/Cl- antiporter ClcA
VATHLGGGSAGREGTAVQMGASLADQVAHLVRLDRPARRLALMAGISGGFGAVFGTPLAGMVFGLEVLAIGAVRFEALFPCLVAAVVGDRVVALVGIHHTPWAVTSALVPSVSALAAAVAVGLASGLVARTFAATTHAIGTRTKEVLPWAPVRLATGGALVALCALALGTTRHLGLGLPLGLEAFTTSLPFSDMALKLTLTAVTLGFGFKGGEVTPLFVIGACLGSALAPWLPLPVDVLAALGFVAVFAGAANTPLACTLMAMELFGAGVGVLAALACVTAYLVSGHQGIYRAQRVAEPKPGV